MRKVNRGSSDANRSGESILTERRCPQRVPDFAAHRLLANNAIDGELHERERVEALQSSIDRELSELDMARYLAGDVS